MPRWLAISVAATALCASLAMAQDAPESLLPPGFDDPAPTPTPRPATSPTPRAQAPQPGAPNVPAGLPQLPVPDASSVDLTRIPSIEELEAMSPEELDDLLGLKPSYDIPAGARRSMARVGVIDSSEGGFAFPSLARQPASLVRAALRGTKGQMVSRWGHVLLRRTLASRLAAPQGMNPVEFAALRARALNTLGEHAVARTLVQDVDTANWNAALRDVALDAYVGTADIVGACPLVRLGRLERKDANWTMLRAICSAYAGEGVLAGQQLDRALREGIAPRIDILLAQRFAGAAGNGRRAVDIEWDGVDELNPWRFALANALGEEIPEGLRASAGAYYQRIWATAPMLGLPQRVQGADRAAREGILSSGAMVDLYSQIYADDAITDDSAGLAVSLREAYVGANAADRLAALEEIWGGDRAQDYGRYVLTAYAAARIPPSRDLAASAAPLIASMLTAGLDRDAAAWADSVPTGSEAWALIALTNPAARGNAGGGAIDSFIDDDGSTGQRKSQFLLAGLAGLGRVSAGTRAGLAERLKLDLERSSKWSRMITRAADVDNAALVALLAGLGMQGSGWEQMTPRHLYHIVRSLDRVGLSAEARMIAAEAVARG